MLRLRQEHGKQITFLDDFLPTALRDLPEELAKMDEWLDDERFFRPFFGHYHEQLGRPSIPAETYLRMIALKHQYNLSDREVCELVEDRISWRRFCRIPWEQPVPHPSSLTKIRRRLDANGGDHGADFPLRCPGPSTILAIDLPLVGANSVFPQDTRPP